MDSNGFYANAQTKGGRTRARTKVLPALALAGMFAIIPATVASSADLVGRVARDGGEPVAGVEISVVDSSGSAAGSVVSDSEGSYEIRGLKPGALQARAEGPVGDVLSAQGRADCELGALENCAPVGNCKTGSLTNGREGF